MEKKRDPLFELGMKIRTEVLGKEHVARSMKNASKHMAPMQDLTTKAAWGMVWGRPGLSRKMRSVANIAILVSMGLDHELELNIKGGMRNGLTQEEIIELLLHTTLFCGYPRAINGFKTAVRVFDEMAAEQALKQPAEPAKKSAKGPIKGTSKRVPKQPAK